MACQKGHAGIYTKFSFKTTYSEMSGEVLLVLACLMINSNVLYSILFMETPFKINFY
jgi:hypothetical protein